MSSILREVLSITAYHQDVTITVIAQTRRSLNMCADITHKPCLRMYILFHWHLHSRMLTMYGLGPCSLWLDCLANMQFMYR